MATIAIVFTEGAYTPNLNISFGAPPAPPSERLYTPNLDFSFDEAGYTPSLNLKFGTPPVPPFERTYTPSTDFVFPRAGGGTTPPPAKTTGQIWPLFG